MDDLTREKTKGLSWWYLKDVLWRRRMIGDAYHTPGFGLASQLFAVMSAELLEKLGPDEGEALIRQAVERFGRERGQHIAAAVQAQGKPLTLKNWLIYTDIDGSNFQARPSIDNHDLVAEVHRCTFMAAAEQWGLKEYAARYCKYADYAILAGYNPDIKLDLQTRHETGKDYCLFRYRMRV